MKIRFLIGLLILTLSVIIKTEADEIILKPEGEYEKISKNIKESSDLFNILTDKIVADKEEASLKIENNLAFQIPPTLLQLGNYYLAKGNFEKAALYHRLSMFRAIIDIRASNDKTLKDTVTILYSWIQSAVSTLGENDKNTYVKNLEKITRTIIDLDKKIPRKYDIRWASLHSLGALSNAPLNYSNAQDFQKIIERERESYIASAKKDGVW